MRQAAWLLPLLVVPMAPPPDLSPRLAWASGPMEARLAFDEPVDPTASAKLVGPTITFRVDGDPTDWHLNVAAVTPADGGRTLILATDPHPRRSRYRVEAPGIGPIGYTLNGVTAAFAEGADNDNAEPLTTLPALDLVEARSKAGASAEHVRAFAGLAGPGRLTLATKLAPAEKADDLVLTSDAPFRATFNNNDEVESAPADGGHRLAFSRMPAELPDDLVVTLPTGRLGKAPTLGATLAGRPIPPGILLLPWAPDPPSPVSPSAPPFPLDGGDPKKGEAIFASEAAKCSTCHKIGGKGGEVGPDLTRPRKADLASLYRAIAEPGAEIHPEFQAYTIVTKDGQVVAGVVRAADAEGLRVADTNGQSTTLKRSEVETFQPLSASIMPVGLAGAIGEADLRHLLAYLQTHGR